MALTQHSRWNRDLRLGEPARFRLRKMGTEPAATMACGCGLESLARQFQPADVIRQLAAHHRQENRIQRGDRGGNQAGRRFGLLPEVEEGLAIQAAILFQKLDVLP